VKYAFEVEMEDGEKFAGVVDARDVRNWEATFKSSFIKADLSMTTMTQLAFGCLRRTGVITSRYPTWDHFDAACVSLGSPEGEDEQINVESAMLADPTLSTATVDSSVS
jgi:hypothetical protein